MADGFLSRWSRRKLDVKEGRAAEPEVAPAADVLPPPATRSAQTPGVAGADIVAASPVAVDTLQMAAEPALPQPAAEAPPPPTLEDVARLTDASDFSRFVSPDVDPGVKNAAMKKLFANPHFNVMDRMDIYIDDYSQPDPMPESMLKQLAAAQFLKLFDEAPKEGDGAEIRELEIERPTGEVANDFTPESVAQSTVERTAASAPPLHDDPDLRLQQDDAPPGEDPGPGHR